MESNTIALTDDLEQISLVYQPILPGLEQAMKYTVNQPPHLIKLPIKSVTMAHLKHRSAQTRA